MKDYCSKSKGSFYPQPEDYTRDCIVDFDFRIVDIFKKMDVQSKKLKEYYKNRVENKKKL